jgi:HD-like signal output (HDOD) protein
VSAESQFIDTMIDDIAKNRLEFPTLPEVALRVRKLIEQPDVTTAQVGKVLSSDPALTSRLLQIANSAMFTGLPPVENIKAAVNRLGLALVRNMVTCVVMKALYQPKMASNIKVRMQALWKHSTKVAAFSHALAKPFPNLRPDEAMLGGLIHDIGTLPILTRASANPEIANDPEKLQYVIDKLHCDIGRLILEAWHFPEELVTVAAEHEDLNRVSIGEVEYVDIVMVANLHSHLGTSHPHGKADWTNIPVFDKLNLTPVESIQALKDAKAEISAVYNLLGGGT